MPVGIITGASKGFGRALTHALAERGWDLYVDARNAEALKQAGFGPNVTVVPGDVTDPHHRRDLLGRIHTLDLLVNNASALGPSPQPKLADYPLDVFGQVYEANVLAPLALVQLAIPALSTVGGTVVNVSSDAAVEAYEGWGGYGSSKAALDRLSAVLAVEHPGLRIYAFDPGDMRTDMHQAAFPGEDISDRAEPETVVPALLRLIDERPPSGRYTK
ncbi:SDR family oxidoreductase [Actinocrispum sp. NPDC049592]|uniref:SDR family NAD(P)-dependent oxidoreductase n=1 Tax=Actinocrispum sp. NPDC049592 TaxID=3154835 RepID=UPI00342EB400